MPHHRPRNIRVQAVPSRTTPGATVSLVTFDCSCGMTDDWTIGDTTEHALDEARRICGGHNPARRQVGWVQ